MATSADNAPKATGFFRKTLFAAFALDAFANSFSAVPLQFTF
jgi:hypothetical protein